MSAGSDASILGYGKMTPLSNINGQYVNTHNINDPAMFTSKTIPGCPGLVGASNNVAAASGKWMGGGGGSKLFKRKIKNITKIYKKMRGGSRKVRSMKRRIRSRVNRRKKTMRVKRRRSQRGGTYMQYQSNVPITPTYSVGGILPASRLGEANPPPISLLANCTNCADNYNHYGKA